MLVDATGKVGFEDYDQVRSGKLLHHPEIGVARWAAANLTPHERALCTVYTSGEHCAMCAAAHGWAGLGRIVYAVSSQQLGAWLAAWKIPRGRVRDLPIPEVLTGVTVDGPAPALAAEISELQRTSFHVSAV